MSKAKRYILQITGALSLLLGCAGILLPLLPTTPFILLSAWCFSSSSAKWHHWLTTHKLFGPILHNWQHYGAIPFKAKLLASLLLGISLILLIMTRLPGWITGAVLVILIGVLIYIWSRPALPNSSQG